jgi:acetolactate synthase-1/2/3 large subunit
MLVAAERPLLHAGAGVSWAAAWDELLALADHLAAPMTASLAARGVVPEDHPRYLHPLNRLALEAARFEADVVVAVGARLGELDGWGREPSWGDPAVQRLIHIDADPTSIGLNRPVDLGIVGDGRMVLSALLTAVRRRTSTRQEHDGFERYRAFTRDWQEQVAVTLNSPEGQINPGRMVQIVREFFPCDAITVMDGGNTSLWTATFNPILVPRSYLYTAKFGHLGTGLPYALGAKLAAPPPRLPHLRRWGHRLQHPGVGDGPPLWPAHRDRRRLRSGLGHGAFLADVRPDRRPGRVRALRRNAL